MSLSDVKITKDYKALVLAGSNVRCIAILGFLHNAFEIEKTVNFNSIQYFSGTSSGSIICLLLSIGVKPFHIFEKILNADKNIVDTSFFQKFKSLEKTFGLMDSNLIFNYVRELVVEKLGFVPTLQEHYEITSKMFEIVSCNLTESKMEVFNHINNPDLDCIDACILSSNIPIFFNSKTFNGSYYVDGNFCNNFPVDLAVEYVNDANDTNDNLNSNILAICTLSVDNSEGSNKFLQYLYDIIILPTMLEHKSKIQKYIDNPNIKFVGIPTNKIFVGISGNISYEQKRDLFLRGYNYHSFDNYENLYEIYMNDNEC